MHFANRSSASVSKTQLQSVLLIFCSFAFLFKWDLSVHLFTSNACAATFSVLLGTDLRLGNAVLLILLVHVLDTSLHFHVRDPGWFFPILSDLQFYYTWMKKKITCKTYTKSIFLITWNSHKVNNKTLKFCIAVLLIQRCYYQANCNWRIHDIVLSIYMYYPQVGIILFKQILLSLHFIPIILQNLSSVYSVWSVFWIRYHLYRLNICVMIHCDLLSHWFVKSWKSCWKTPLWLKWKKKHASGDALRFSYQK